MPIAVSRKIENMKLIMRNQTDTYNLAAKFQLLSDEPGRSHRHCRWDRTLHLVKI